MENIQLSKKGKIKNFIYYNKWYIIAAAVAVVLLSAAVIQATGKDDYDMLVLYAGPCYFSEAAQDEVEQAFEAAGKDYNGDGKKAYKLIPVTVLNDDQLAQAQQSAKDDNDILYIGNQKENIQEYHDQMMSGEAAICLIDAAYYADSRDKSRLVKLSDVLGAKPENALDDYGIYLKDTDFGNYFPALASLPDDTVLCLKKQTLIMRDKVYEYDLELFKSIVSFKSN